MDRPAKKAKLKNEPPNPEISRLANHPPPFLLSHRFQQLPICQPTQVNQSPITVNKAPVVSWPTVTNQSFVLNYFKGCDQHEARLQRLGIIPHPPWVPVEWSSSERPIRGRPRIQFDTRPRRRSPPSPTPKSRSSRSHYPNGTYLDLQGPNPATMTDQVWLRERGYINQYGFNKRSGIYINTRADHDRGVAAMKDMREMEQEEWEEANQ